MISRFKFFSFFAILICTICNLNGIGFSATFVIGPEDNSAYLDQREPDTNFVDKRGILVVSELNENARTVIHFDLSQWSPDSIFQVKLFLYHYSGGNYTDFRTTSVFALTTSFKESTATWNYPWTTPGGDFDSSISTSTNVPLTYNWVEWNVTDIVKNRWSNVRDCGFLIKDPVEDAPSPSGPYVRFRSHRYLSEEPSQLPYLAITTDETGVEDAEHDYVSRSFWLGQNFPNPFNFKTLLEFTLPRTAQVSLIVYNIRGEKVKTLLEQEKYVGTYTVEWDGTNQRGVSVSSGIYFFQLRAENFIETKRLLFLK